MRNSQSFFIPLVTINVVANLDFPPCPYRASKKAPPKNLGLFKKSRKTEKGFNKHIINTAPLHCHV